MATTTPDRIEVVKTKTIISMERGKTFPFVVAADGLPGLATLAHLIPITFANEISTALTTLVSFPSESEARSAYPEIPKETS